MSGKLRKFLDASPPPKKKQRVMMISSDNEELSSRPALTKRDPNVTSPKFTTLRRCFGVKPLEEETEAKGKARGKAAGEGKQ